MRYQAALRSDFGVISRGGPSYLGVDQTGAGYIATAVQASKDDGVTVVNFGSLTFAP
jgi:hypothetical protein